MAKKTKSLKKAKKIEPTKPLVRHAWAPGKV
jgi:hypothetical protein